MNIFTFDNETLNNFATAQYNKTVGYLQKTFGLRLDDCQDIFQEAFITLFQNIKTGKLTELTCSLSTYFTSICRNKAMEVLRDAAKMPTTDDETSLSLMHGEFQDDKIDSLIKLEDKELTEERQTLVESIVNDLPSPCNEILWGFYRDRLSLKTLAQMFNYSEGSIKVTKHRCCEKFRNRYLKMCKTLF